MSSSAALGIPRRPVRRGANRSRGRGDATRTL